MPRSRQHWFPHWPDSPRASPLSGCVHKHLRTSVLSCCLRQEFLKAVSLQVPPVACKTCDFYKTLCQVLFMALRVNTLGPFFLYLILLFMSPNRFPNTTHEGFNVTLHTTLVVTTKLVLPTAAKPILPVQTGEQAQQEEQSSGMTIFFTLLVLGECRDTITCHLECVRCLCG